jgi:hypothetical protein
MGRRSFTLLAVLVVLSGAALFIWKKRGNRSPVASNPAAARTTVVEYLHALEKRDSNGILKLVPSDYNAATEVNERLHRFGGAHADAAHIRISADISPQSLSASIRTTGPDGRELAWTENLFWHDGTWKLVLGGRPDGRPASDIQRPEP